VDRFPCVLLRQGTGGQVPSRVLPLLRARQHAENKVQPTNAITNIPRSRLRSYPPDLCQRRAGAGGPDPSSSSAAALRLDACSDRSWPRHLVEVTHELANIQQSSTCGDPIPATRATTASSRADCERSGNWASDTWTGARRTVRQTVFIDKMRKLQARTDPLIRPTRIIDGRREPSCCQQPETMVAKGRSSPTALMTSALLGPTWNWMRQGTRLPGWVLRVQHECRDDLEANAAPHSHFCGRRVKSLKCASFSSRGHVRTASSEAVRQAHLP